MRAQAASPVMFTVVLPISKILSIPATRAIPSTGRPTEERTIASITIPDGVTSIESSAFNKKFNTYSDDRENAFYIITPQLQLAMLDIEKALPGGLKILFRGDELVIVAAGNTTTFSGINLKESDNYNINVILDSILAPGFVVEKMNLDHKFFLNENDIADLVKKNKENKDEEDKAAIEKALENNKDALDINKEDIEKIKDTIDSNQ